MGRFRAKIDYILKHSTVIYNLFVYCGSAFFKFIGLFIPLKKNRVLFTAHGRLYNDSPRAIYEYMISNHKYDKYELIWGVENPDKIEIPGRATKIQIDTPRYFLTSLSCKYWITCVNIERGLRYKKKNTVYLNTWHGFPVKGSGYNGLRKVEDFSYIDYFTVAGEFDKNFYKECFLIPDSHFLMTGFPRMDELYNVREEEIQVIKKRLNIPLYKKVIMYAPTWRDSGDGGKTYSLKPPIDIYKWEEVLKDEYVMLMRLHPYTNKLMGFKFNEFVRDYSTYQVVNDLLKITDILISDYSGIFFEYAVLERPIICFGYDYEAYEKERGYGMNLEKEMPNGVLNSEDEVISLIINMNYSDECKKTKALKEKYLEYGGNAIESCLHTLFEGNQRD